MPIYTLLLTALLIQAPPEPAPDPSSSPAPAEPTTLPDVEDAASEDPGFFASEVESGQSSAPPMPEIEQLPSRDPDSAPGVEADASASDPGPAGKRPVIVFDPAREPAGSEGGSFFDPGKLGETGPGGGGIVQLRGFVGASFITTERTNLRQLTDAGNFERVAPLPFFGAGTATLYVGAAIWADAIYARISLEYLAIPRVTSGTEDILAPANRQLLVESAALEINPFFWAERAPRWFREGFKVTAGVFIVPFGIEDEEHAAPVNWFTTRARSMTNGRVYPGTWSDIGAVLKFRPSFREHRPIRPLEIDIGLVNGDPCTQTRWTDSLYNPTGLVAPCERVRRPEELPDGVGAGGGGADPRADLGFLGVGPDNNQNKSLIARLSVFPLADLQLGGSLAWGRHPRLLDFDERAAGRTTIDVPQAASWRAGAHLALDLDRMVSSAYPLPMLRGEFIVGSDAAPEPREGQPQTLADRWVMGGYAQIAQPLYRRKRSNLPGLMLQYRIDWADPDSAVPGRVAGVPLVSNHADAYVYDETQLGHSFGLRWLVVPRFTIKADYTLIREDGGRANQLYNDRFVFQLVGDF
ncbi:hypothetical protein [Enhygromyxa salina]|uniref:Phosphate-selective porin O and P n=1 Tax=Enhygromyxa salina TaxID=215803 RepID=A0A2S9XKZ4_9BACT|nr:hypothetical protein [Enhygromyxa salina]PRP93548.1 hypothetical protein ENSA7_79760 [Enhygromyxa salina]